MTRTIDELLAEARARIERYEPAEALAAMRAGAAILDTRDADSRRRDGVVPGSLHIPRTVLEWRVDPTSPWRNTHLDVTTQTVIVLCDHGYSSSLAAAMLADLGVPRVGDVVGGFAAWVDAGLPTIPAPELQHGGLPGTGPPD
jgi:rhodanese-related sulfurtransferase